MNGRSTRIIMANNLKDIAERLNISISTVSRALNNKGTISDAMRQKILDTAREMGYQPNETARSLKTKRTSMIGLIAPDITDVFYSKLLKATAEEALKKGYNVVYCDSDGDIACEENYYRLLLSKNVCGIIVATAGENNIYDDVKENERLVFVDNRPSCNIREGSGVFCVSIDHEKAGCELTDYLVGRGYRKIAAITGNLEETSALYRLEGYRRCIKKHNLSEWVVEGDYHYEGGYVGMMNIIKSGKLPDAVVAHNYLMAYGAIAAMRENSLSVPDDIAIACFDAVDETNVFAPKLTCIVSPIKQLAKSAVDIVIEQFENKGSLSGREKDVILDYRFLEGQST